MHLGQIGLAGFSLSHPLFSAVVGTKCDLFGYWMAGLVHACLGLSLGLMRPKLLSLGCSFISSVIGVHSGGDFCISEFESIYILLKDSSSWCLVSISKLLICERY